ncbi:unnamed protein product [Dibothriocephalus latus]|uniref:NLE domain-containing protein n=1 Tax=Dibothriocephalus latus TaxID=60516 RepID=A0A3P7LVA8_DIBLA|nr:unnamed protein product [Dibothriocephalus latus]
MYTNLGESNEEEDEKGRKKKKKKKKKRNCVLLEELCEYSVPSDPISVPTTSTVNDLQNIITQLLNEELVVFDFLINNEFIEGTLDEFINKKKISAETLDVEYTVRQAAPVVSGEIVHEDFVSCVSRRQNYVLTCAYDGAVKLHTIDGKGPIFTLALNEKVKVVEWVDLDETQTGESVFLTGGFAQVVRLWVWNQATRSVRCAAICRGHQGTVLSMASNSQTNDSKDKIFATGSWDSSIKIWSSGNKTPPGAGSLIGLWLFSHNYDHFCSQRSPEIRRFIRKD